MTANLPLPDALLRSMFGGSQVHLTDRGARIYEISIFVVVRTAPSTSTWNAACHVAVSRPGRKWLTYCEPAVVIFDEVHPA